MSQCDPECKEKFHTACRYGQDDVVKELLDSGMISVDDKRYNATGLIDAAWGGNLEVCKLLIDFGCDVNWCDDLGNSALYYSIYRNMNDVMELLLSSGANPFAFVTILIVTPKG